MRTFQEFMMIVEGMTMKDFKKQRSRQKQKEKRADDKIAPGRRAGIHNPSASPERAARHRANVDPDFEGNDERNYPGGKLRSKKVRKAKALGELGEAYDKDVMGSSQIRRTGEGGRIGAERKKTTPERRRMKAVGGGKQEPVEYKDRSDIGSQRQRSEREQAPEKERGSAALSPKEQQRKAYLERKAREGKGPATSKEKEKEASKLLSKKKEEKPTSPDYEPQKASGMTRSERMSQQRKGEAALKDIMKDQEFSRYEKETGQKATGKAKTKLLGRVSQRMAN